MCNVCVCINVLLLICVILMCIIISNGINNIISSNV